MSRQPGLYYGANREFRLGGLGKSWGVDGQGDPLPLHLTRSSAYRWVILAVAFLGIFGAAGLSRFGYSAVLPDMQKALGLSGAEAGALASWNLAGYTLMALVGGFLASRFGARRVVTAGITITAAGLLLTGLSNSLAAASAWRLLTGLGNGMVMAPSVALMAVWFNSRQLGVASAIASSSTGLGLVVAGPVVPRLVAAGGADGWRLAWYFFAAVAFAVAVLTWILERDRPYKPTRESESWASEGRTSPGESEEKTDPADLLADLKSVLRSGYIWHLGSIYFLYGFAYLIYYTFFQKRLTMDLGLGSGAAGNLFLVAGASSLVFGVLWGAFSDRVGRGKALAVLFLADAAAVLMFVIRPSLPALIVSAVLFGSGVFSVPGLIGAACGDRFGSRLAFASLGFVTVFIGAGQATGPYVGGLLEDVFGSLGPSYWLSAAIFGLGAVAAFLLPDSRTTRNPGAGQALPEGPPDTL